MRIFNSRLRMFTETNGPPYHRNRDFRGRLPCWINYYCYMEDTNLNLRQSWIFKVWGWNKRSSLGKGKNVPPQGLNVYRNWQFEEKEKLDRIGLLLIYWYHYNTVQPMLNIKLCLSLSMNKQTNEKQVDTTAENKYMY